jgi:hypothetical protein
VLSESEKLSSLSSDNDDDSDNNEQTVMPHSDNSFEDEESDNSDGCEKGKGSKKLDNILSTSDRKFKKVAVHKRGKNDDSVSLSSEEEEMIRS